jgi:hypothetical protein
MRRRIVVAALAGSLVIAACGGSTPDAPVSADGTTITLPEPEPGPIPDLPVDAASAASPLPEVTVRRINGEGGWAQFRNELPADQPLLVWFWAPH